MKPYQLLAAATAAFGLAGSAFAVEKVFIAGAPALRTELTTAIENLIGSQVGVTKAWNGGALITANVITWTGATIGGHTDVTIKLTYNGSAGGWQTNSASKNVRFLPDGVGTGGNKTDVLTDTGAAAETHVPDFHISNEYQDSTPWSGTNSLSFPENGPVTYNPINDNIVGILPLKIVASKGAPTGLTLTPQLAQQLYLDGEIRLSQLTGDNLNDYNKKVYPLSRGIDSGIRTLWAAANGVGTSSLIKNWTATVTNTTNKPVEGVTVVAPGVGYTSAPTITIAAPPSGVTATAQATVANGKITGITLVAPGFGGSGYNTAPGVTISGGGGSLASARTVIQGGTITAKALWPATTLSPDTRVLGVTTPLGQGGYPTFGPLLTALTSTFTAPLNPGDVFLTILGVSDAESAIQGGAKEVKWNGYSLGNLGTYGNVGGVPNTPTNVGSSTPTLSNGSYDVWGYVRLPYRDDIGTIQKDVLDDIATQLIEHDSPILLKDVNVQRFQDGGAVVQGQFLP